MRLWSLHPTYLDAKGLVALWREGLLAKAVLSGHTKGYRNHPQLERFRTHPNPNMAIDAYLWEVYKEAKRRSYKFNHKKLDPYEPCELIMVSTGQLAYEFEHLQRKLLERTPKQYQQNLAVQEVLPHPLVKITNGGIAKWERAMSNAKKQAKEE